MNHLLLGENSEGGTEDMKSKNVAAGIEDVKHTVGGSETTVL
jgi:hypothetical protein